MKQKIEALYKTFLIAVLIVSFVMIFYCSLYVSTRSALIFLVTFMYGALSLARAHDKKEKKE